MDTSPILPVPRLRLTRYSHAYADNHTPVAGPSRLSPQHESSEDEGDAESTPRMPPVPIEQDSPRPTAQSAPMDTPAARLRALLARVPNSNSSATPRASNERVSGYQTPSEADSDLDPPYSTLATPSIARESLRELFSHVLRDPGNTPRKGRLRRNSIGGNEVDPSPRVARIEEERSQNKGKRRSMSDEEAEHLSNVSRRSDESARSTTAATFDALRERLAKSRSLFPTIPRDQTAVMDMSMPPSMPPSDTAEDHANMLRELDKSEAAPPPVAETPARTFQLSEHMQTESNLLDGDSEMQKALRTMDSSELESLPNGRQLPFPPSRPSNVPTSHGHGRPLSWSSHSKSHSAHNMPPLRRASAELDSSTSRASSSQSDRGDGLHERERRWNHPSLSKSPMNAGIPPYARDNGRSSPTRMTSRRSSGASQFSFDDGSSSRTSSLMSRSEYQERTRELEQERQREREREWNKPKPSLSRSTSSLDNNDPSRSRTNSQPTRPDSAQSFLTPDNARSRHVSLDSMPNSSRAASPAESVSGREPEPEEAQACERNWNSPRPKWSSSSSSGRTPSPIPMSASKTPPYTKSSRYPSHIRSRANSTASQRGDKSQSPGFLDRSSPREKLPMRSKSPLLPSDAGNRTSHMPDHERSPSRGNGDDSHLSSLRSKFGWSFPQNRTQLPPLELEGDSSERAKPVVSRPSSQLSVSSSESRIPVRSPRKSDAASKMPSRTEESPSRRRGHRRSFTEFSQPRVAVSSRSIEAEPQPSHIHPIGSDESVFATDEESHLVTSTPTARPTALPPPDAKTSPPSLPTSSKNLNNNASSLPTTIAKPESPPPTPQDRIQRAFSLQTPPRPSFSSISKIEFQTPSPPRNMPDLPEPPSFMEDDVEENEHTPINVQPPVGNLTMMKTPRPPGAWLQTPGPRQVTQDPFVRPQSTPPGNGEVPHGNELETPVSTWPRANSAPTQTPAPPGAWMPTPGTSVRRKSILKVRFDVESETTVSDVGEHPSGEQPSTSDAGTWDTGKQQFMERLAAAKADPDASGPPPIMQANPLDPPSTPPSVPVRAPRKSPKVRVVDAYGRETSDAGPDDQSTRNLRNGGVVEARKAPTTPRNTSRVKIVDAMGREIEDAVEEQAFEGDTPLSHNEALARVRETVAHMAEDLSEADRSRDALVVDEDRVEVLEDASKAARTARQHISKTLQVVKGVGGDMKSKYGPLRESMRKSRFLPTAIVERRVQWNASLICALILIQLVLLLMMYRYSNIRARRTFLTTYYDPFYADLHLYTTRDTFDRSIPSHPTWSLSYIPDTIARAGWTGAIIEVWGNATAFLSQSSEVWRTQSRGQAPLSWPPT